MLRWGLRETFFVPFLQSTFLRSLELDTLEFEAAYVATQLGQTLIEFV